MQEIKTLLHQQVATSERSSPEVISRLRPQPPGAPSPQPAASFPEPDLSAADRAAAAAASASPSFASGGDPGRPQESAGFPGPPGDAWGTAFSAPPRSNGAGSPAGGDVWRTGTGAAASESSMQSEPAKPADYMGILRMLERVRPSVPLGHVSSCSCACLFRVSVCFYGSLCG